MFRSSSIYLGYIRGLGLAIRDAYDDPTVVRHCEDPWVNEYVLQMLPPDPATGLEPASDTDDDMEDESD